MIDDELLDRLRKGERVACSAFVRRHAPSLRRYFHASVDGDVEELVFAAFAALMQMPDRSGGNSGPDGREDNPVRASLFGVAHMVLRRRLAEPYEEPA